MTTHDLNSAQRKLLRYITLGDAAFPLRGAVGQFRTDHAISGPGLEEHLLYLEALGLVELIERPDFGGRFDVGATADGLAWVRDNPE